MSDAVPNSLPPPESKAAPSPPTPLPPGGERGAEGPSSPPSGGRGVGGEGGRPLARHFRWQSLFQHSADPLFLLDRRRRLLFVNHAWEALTGVPAAEAHLIAGLGRRPRPSSPGDSWEEVLAHALTPPPEVVQGTPGRVRRLLPGREGPGSGRLWWEVEFLPLRQEGEGSGFFLLGRIRVLQAEAPGTAPLPERLANLRQRAATRHSLESWAASSVPAVRRLVEQVRLACRVRVPVLLVGEAGSGKQTLARAIHYQGPDRERPFIALDCRRLPSAALAAVLFGEWSGPGGAGAFYLNEPACLPRDLQLRLCAMLVGDRAGRPRLLAGAVQLPDEDVRTGRLLEDLACALGTLVLAVPPLRERRADLPLLVEGLLARANAEGEVRLTGLAPDAWEVVRTYSWPGNLRELYRALFVAGRRTQGERITAMSLPAAVRQAVNLALTPGPAADRSLPLDKLLAEAERRLIELALRRTRGHQTKAAQILGIWRQRLQRRMEVLGFQTARGEPPAEEEDSTGEK
jgi:transcriptional regulator with AAA-type ATPase domain